MFNHLYISSSKNLCSSYKTELFTFYRAMQRSEAFSSKGQNYLVDILIAVANHKSSFCHCGTNRSGKYMTGNTVIAKFTAPDDTLINISDAPFQMFFYHISQIWQAFSHLGWK